MINAAGVLNTLIDFLVPLTTILILAVVVYFLGAFIARGARNWVETNTTFSEERKQHLFTLIQIGQWSFNILFAIIFGLMIISRLGVDITPLLTGLGVGGLALSLGLQTLIGDLVAGMFILLENHFGVGDYIEVGSAAGTVEHMTLRTTYLRDLSGRLHIIPNGEIRVVANHTRTWSQAQIEVGVSYEDDLDHVLKVMRQTSEELAKEPQFAAQILEPPVVQGPISLGDWAITMRVLVKTKPGQQGAVARELQKRLHAAFRANGITIPYPRREIIQLK